MQFKILTMVCIITLPCHGNNKKQGSNTATVTCMQLYDFLPEQLRQDPPLNDTVSDDENYDEARSETTFLEEQKRYIESIEPSAFASLMAWTTGKKTYLQALGSKKTKKDSNYTIIISSTEPAVMSTSIAKPGTLTLKLPSPAPTPRAARNRANKLLHGQITSKAQLDSSNFGSPKEKTVTAERAYKKEQRKQKVKKGKTVAALVAQQRALNKRKARVHTKRAPQDVRLVAKTS